MGVVSLTKQLEDAREKIVNLEDEIARLSRREERRVQRLEKLRCHKCYVKVDTRTLQRSANDRSVRRSCLESNPQLTRFSSFVDPADIGFEPEPAMKTSEKLRADLHAVNEQLASMKQQWDEERRKLLGENATLKDATDRLNAEVRQAKKEVKRLAEGDRAKAGTQSVGALLQCKIKHQLIKLTGAR